MASHHYGVNFGGDQAVDVTEAGAGTGLNLNLEIVYDATNNSKLAALKAIEAIRQAITQDTWPPA
jgi:hypothetical protein